MSEYMYTVYVCVWVADRGAYEQISERTGDKYISIRIHTYTYIYFYEYIWVCVYEYILYMRVCVADHHNYEPKFSVE